MAPPVHMVAVLFIWICTTFFRLRNWIKNRRKKRLQFNKMLEINRKKMELEHRLRIKKLYEEMDRKRKKFILWKRCLNEPSRKHRFWIKTSTKSGEFASKFLKNNWLSEDYVYNFRVSKCVFDMLCEDLSVHLKTQNTRFRNCTPIQIKIACALYYLAENCSMRTIMNVFGVGRSSVFTYVNSFCKAVIKVYLSRYIPKPGYDDMKKLAINFESRFKIPNCVGAIDGCHIPILCPSDEKRTSYHCRKQFYSIVLQGIVDAEGLFWNVNLGWPGAVHDSRVFQSSSIYHNISSGKVLPQSSLLINDCIIPYYLIGDGAYPLLEWLMKPFTDKGKLTPEEALYNESMSGMRVVVEHAFGRLKGRWRRLLKRCDSNLENTKLIVLTCCILHNMCEIKNVPFQKDIVENDNKPRFKPIVNVHNTLPKKIRQELVNFISDMKQL